MAEERLIFRRVLILAHAQRDTRLFVRIQELGAEDADRQAIGPQRE